jgi:hypothetical protein
MSVESIRDVSAKEQRHEPDASLLQKISDRRFIDQLTEVQDLKRFLFEEKAKFDPTQLQSIDLGVLNNLSYSEKGRAPTSGEWKLLDEKISVLASYLTDDLRQKIRIRELRIFFGVIPLTFLVAALLTIMYFFSFGALFNKGTFGFNLSYLVCLIVWTVTQGGLGACAYLGTRVAIRRAEKIPLEAGASGDATDITDGSILKVRIILGCLFGSLIGLPIAGSAMVKLAKAMYPDANEAVEAADFMLMVLPFMVGFSTNLVLAILDRFIDSVRTFFGISTK